MLGKIAVRNIPADIWAGLETLAARHYRSTEAEARYALRSWVEPLLQRKERSARRAEVSARLRDMLEQVNRVSRARFIKPSHIAKAIGEDYAEPVENWFAGELEPSFRQLDAIAEYLGGMSEWLQHGDRQMFPVESIRISEDPAEGTKWLLDIADTDEKVSFLHLVREEGSTGSFTVVKQYGDWRCKIYSTPYHVSEEIGAGGEGSLAALSVTLHLLYKYYVRKAESRLVIKSYVLPKESYQALLGGNEHPLTLLARGADLPWWEDFWDIGQYKKQDYWPGWKSLCERIYRAVEHRTFLTEQRDLIKSEKHPLLTDKNPQ
ncbi:hypothetical protein AEMCBJ_14565 [Cupriavidus necator]|uniref:FitA-like ribbon-helix-helix domain-containing protein n=1 Tax=Cupriavidus necator TaxID=106590 RepID=UPI003F7392ED